MEPERLLQKLLVLSSFLILAGIISINVSFGSVRQFLFDYHHDSLTSIHPSGYAARQPGTVALWSAGRLGGRQRGVQTQSHTTWTGKQWRPPYKQTAARRTPPCLPGDAARKPRLGDTMQDHRSPAPPRPPRPAPPGPDFSLPGQLARQTSRFLYALNSAETLTP